MTIHSNALRAGAGPQTPAAAHGCADHAATARQRPAPRRRPLARLAGSLALAGLIGGALTACGSSDDKTASAELPVPGTGTPSASTTTLARRTLLVDLDGVTYDALRQGIASGQLPNLARLQPQLAYSGGVLNDVSQQPNLDAPGWATLLTGTWASRHRIFAIAPGQKPAVPTLFSLAKASGTSRTGAAVASAPLATLLAPDHAAGALDTLASCAQDATPDDCVTRNAIQMIGRGDYATVVAQYHSAEDVALNDGLASSQYAQALARLDAAVGTLLSETAKHADSQWLVVVASSHGLNANGRADGLPEVPQSAAFIAVNQDENNGQRGSTPALPATVAGLYRYASIADVTPTILAHLNKTPANPDYAMDGAQLIGAQPPTLAVQIAEDNTTRARAVLAWSAPASAAITLMRDGKEIAKLPAGTTTYTDPLADRAELQTGKYRFSYAVIAGTAARAVLTPQISYIKAQPPVPLAATLVNGLTVYYPFGQDPQLTAPVDALGHSTMGPWAADANGGAMTADPLGGHGLFIDTNIANAAGYDGYRLTPQSSSQDVVNSAVASGGAFSIGFWYKAPACSTNTVGEPIFSNKTGYATSGGTAGIIISMFGCGAEFNVADGSHRTDTNSPYIPFSENQWVYFALVVDVGGKTMSGYVFDPILGSQSQTHAFAAGMVAAALAGVNQSSEVGFGLGEDGTGKFYMAKNGQKAGSYNPSLATTDKPMQMAFSDLAMWNRALTQDELSSIFLSQKPLSGLLAK
ncbi:alkaline phosphatase family protein [Cupriavidus malaysiensis]|uniref:alkaline phosphatase family protein n=1 Tax=Cupriavidus malaysiensis TaxID=367825 RepID=UPI000A623315|nr:alkaline phosphatase family protein [Cupriavidus malaysiensis]